MRIFYLGNHFLPRSHRISKRQFYFYPFLPCGNLLGNFTRQFFASQGVVTRYNLLGNFTEARDFLPCGPAPLLLGSSGWMMGWEGMRGGVSTWMSRWKLGSMVSKWVVSPTYKWGILGL